MHWKHQRINRKLIVKNKETIETQRCITKRSTNFLESLGNQWVLWKFSWETLGYPGLESCFIPGVTDLLCWDHQFRQPLFFEYKTVPYYQCTWMWSSLEPHGWLLLDRQVMATSEKPSPMGNPDPLQWVQHGTME